MKKTMKKTLLSVFVATFLACVLMFSACGVKASVWDATIENGATLTNEWGYEYILPDVVAKAENGTIVGGTTTSVVGPDGQPVNSDFGIIRTNQEGDYVVTVKQNGLDDFVYTIKCEDTVNPVIKVKTAPETLEKGNDYDLPGFEYSDLAGIKNGSVVVERVYKDAEGNEVPLQEGVDLFEFTGRFTVNHNGWYIFRTSVKDKNDNQTSYERKYYVKDANWVATDLEEPYLATFDSEEYISSISGGLESMNKSINEEMFFEEYKGVEGVVKVACQWNNTVTGQASTRVKFTQPVHKDDVGGINMKLMIENENSNDGIRQDIQIYRYEETRNIGITNPVDGVYFHFVNCGEWVDFYLNEKWVDLLADADGYINGIQLVMSRGWGGMASLEGSFVFGNITKADRIDAPTNLTKDGTVATWDAVEGAQGYKVVFGDTTEILDASTTSYDVGTSEGILYVYTLGDNISKVISEPSSAVFINPADGFLASYDNPLYAQTIALRPDGFHGAGGQTLRSVTIEESYSDRMGTVEQNVAVLDLFSGVDVNNLGHETTVIKIKLPEGHSADGYTIRWAVDHPTFNSTNGANIRFIDEAYYTDGTIHAIYQGNTFKSMNVWHTTYIPDNTASDEIMMMFHKGNTPDSHGNNNFKVYISWIKDGDNPSTCPETVDGKHVAGEWETIDEVSCSVHGLKSISCTECGEILEVSVIEKLPHTPSDWQLNEGSCTETGSKFIDCTVCDEVLQTKKLAKANHVYVDGVCACGKEEMTALDGEIASFNEDGYLEEVELPFAGTDHGIGQTLVSKEILETVTLGESEEESTVMKIVVASGTDVNGLGHNTVGVIIPLAQAYSTEGYTIRWAVNYGSLHNSGATVRFIESAYALGDAWVEENNHKINGITIENLTWYETYVGCTNESLDDVYMLVHCGSAGAQNVEIYVSWVKEGDTRVFELPEGYVADFDDPTYTASAFGFSDTQVAGVSGYGIYPESGLVVEHNGTENVGKYYFYTGSENGAHTSAIVKLTLSKPFGEDGYTIRWALDYEDRYNTAGANIFFSNADSTQRYVHLEQGRASFPADGAWTETYVDPGASGDTVYIHLHKGHVAGLVFTLYVDWVKDGNVNGVGQVEVPEGYLATFTNETYVSTAFSFAEQVPGVGGYTTMEGNGTVVTYNDVENVGRYHFITGAENGIHTSCIIKIALPNDLAHGANGYTIRYAVEYTSNWEGGNLYFRNGGGASSTAYLQLNGNTFPANGVWTETYVDTNGTEGNAIYMHIHKGQVQNVEVNLYIEWIKDGDQLPWGTEEGELGSFNSDKYLTGVTLPFAGTSNGVGQSLISAEILESVELGGVTESSVLKVVVNSGQDSNNLGHVTAGVKIPLAEAYTTAGYTVRWAINFPSLENGNVRFFESAYANGGSWVDANNIYMQGNTLANDTWYTTYVGCTNESLSEIYMMAHGGYLGVQNVTFYISWVVEGDVTNA